MDADAIGAAAAMEAIKQTAASSKAPAGGFLAGKGSGSSSSKPGRAGEESDEETAARGASGGGLQDKLVRGVIVSWCRGRADGTTDVACDVSGGQVVRQEERGIEWYQWERVPGQGTRWVPRL